MASILDLMNSIESAGDRGRQRGQQSRLASLYSGALQAPQEQRGGYLAEIAKVSPDAANSAAGHFDKMDDTARQRLGQYAAAFSALPDDQKAQAYPQLAEMGRSLGLPVPQGDYQPQYARGIQQLAQAFGGGGVGGNVQSTYIDAQGNRVAIMRDGTTQVLGQNAPNNQIIDTGAGFFGVNKGNLQAAPVMTGGQAPQRAPGEVPFSIDPSLPQEVQASIRANEPAYAAAPDGAQVNIPQGMGGQLRSAPKQAAPPTQLQLNADARDAERLRLAQETAASTAQIKQQAADDKRVAAQRRQQASADSANQLVSAIDTLTQSQGFGNLGTVSGDIAANTPFFRNATKDSDAQLKNIAGQVALSTMNQLKTLSAAGATGFGSLSAPELKLLNNSIATLQSEDISHAQLVASLKVIRDKMAKIANWQPEQGSAPAQSQGGGVDDLLSKYGVK